MKISLLDKIVWNFDIVKTDFLGHLGIWTYGLKFFVWGRKIEENVEFLRDMKREKEIKPYLEKCYFYRKKFLKEPEKFYEKRIDDLFKKFEVK